eukprot:316969-Hanusia_phi.AAC.2
MRYRATLPAQRKLAYRSHQLDPRVLAVHYGDHPVVAGVVPRIDTQGGVVLDLLDHKPVQRRHDVSSSGHRHQRPRRVGSWATTSNAARNAVVEVHRVEPPGLARILRLALRLCPDPDRGSSQGLGLVCDVLS